MNKHEDMDISETINGIEACVTKAKRHMIAMEGIFITADEAEQIAEWLKELRKLKSCKQ